MIGRPIEGPPEVQGLCKALRAPVRLARYSLIATLGPIRKEGVLT